MKRIHKTVKALGLLMRDPWKLNLILDRNAEWEAVVRRKHTGVSLPVVPLDHFVPDTILVDPVTFLDGGSLPTDLALLKQIASGIPRCKYFEIGTWRGESVANVSSVSEACYSLNLSDEEINRTAISADYVDSHRIFSKDRDNVVHLFGDSKTYDYSRLNLKFDLVFIDGDHHYEAIVRDTQNVLRYLCHEETIIVWHDYAYTPESVRYETMAAILDACPATLHSRLYHVGNTNCALLYRKELPSLPFRKFARPGYYFSVQLKINPMRSD